MLYPTPFLTALAAALFIVVATPAPAIAQAPAPATAQASAAGPTAAQDALIRKVLAERLPKLPKIDEVSRTPIAGLWEVRYNGTELLYADEKGDHILVGGSMYDTKTQTDLTEARIDKLMALDYSKLPVKDAIVFKQGNGARKMAVFVDPNCGYCKRFERDITQVKDVTIHTYLLPILGPDSVSKSKDIWCSKDPGKAWRAWMLDGVAAPKAPAGCSTAAVDRNVAFARTHRINGTPAVFFEDGTRKPGAIPLQQVEQLLTAATATAKK